MNDSTRFLSPLRCGLFALALSLALGTAMAAPLRRIPDQLSQGAISPVTIKSSVSVPPYPSTTLTEDRRNQAANRVSSILIFDPVAPIRQRSEALDLFRWFEHVGERPAQNTPQQALPTGAPVPSAETVNAVRALSPEQWQQVQDEMMRLLTEAHRERIGPEQLPSAKAQLVQRVTESFNQEQRAVVVDLVELLLIPNMAVDNVATERLRQAAIAEVQPVYTSITKGETIVRDGQIITALHLEKLDAAGLLGATLNWAQTAGILLLAAVLSVIFALFAFVTKPISLTSNRRLLLIALIFVGAVLAARFALPGRPLWALAFPAATGALLLTSLLQLSLGLAGSVLLALVTAYAADFSSEPLIYAAGITPLETLEKVVLYLMGSIAATLTVRQAQRVSQFFAAGSAASVAGMAVVFAFWLQGGGGATTDLAWSLLAALGGGLLAAALAVGSCTVLGILFDVTTRMQLHELAQPDHPLLKVLLQEAPGTYYHSLLVGNLAEQAVEAVGGDALLARVGAYYHDIGKTRNPGFFIENQRRGENVHDQLDPLTSASLIIAHVPDGVRLAEEHRLPKRIQAFIREHHGCRLATAFYNKATHTDANVNPELFRYPGPPPQTRETAIVMLADSVEATARSEGLQATEELDALVERVVNERVDEGQLNYCDLTLRDIDRIKAIFKAALRGIYHPRIQYPVPASATPATASAPNSLPQAGRRALQRLRLVPPRDQRRNTR